MNDLAYFKMQLRRLFDLFQYSDLLISNTYASLFQIPNFWCPTSVMTPAGPKNFPLPEATSSLNFINSQGFFYEQKHVRDAILAGTVK